MIKLNLDDLVELKELFEQINYALSLKFSERWRHKYSETFIKIFQEILLNSFKNKKPVKLSFIVNQYSNKFGYDKSVVKEFLEDIDISLYYPIIYRDRK